GGTVKWYQNVPKRQPVPERVESTSVRSKRSQPVRTSPQATNQADLAVGFLKTKPCVDANECGAARGTSHCAESRLACNENTARPQRGCDVLASHRRPHRCRRELCFAAVAPAAQ